MKAVGAPFGSPKRCRSTRGRGSDSDVSDDSGSDGENHPAKGWALYLRDCSAGRPAADAAARGLAALLFGNGDRHVTAEILHEEAVEAGERVSLATVYNTLHQFKRAGLLREIAIGGPRRYFDTNTSNHNHFFVEDEGELVDIPGDSIRVDGLPEPPRGHARSPTSTWSCGWCRSSSRPARGDVARLRERRSDSAARSLDHLVLVDAPQLHLLDVAAKAADRDAAPASVAADDVGEHAGFDLATARATLAVVVAQTQPAARPVPPSPPRAGRARCGGRSASIAAPSRSVPSASRTCRQPSNSLITSTRQARAAEDPGGRVVGARALAQVDPVGFQADEARERQAAAADRGRRLVGCARPVSPTRQAKQQAPSPARRQGAKSRRDSRIRLARVCSATFG